MLNKCDETERKVFYSLIWPDEAACRSWRIRQKPDDSFIKDLCIDKILTAYIFNEDVRRNIEELFEKPCMDEHTIGYRLDIMQDFIENVNIANAFGRFVKAIISIEKSSVEKYPNPKEIHVHTCFFEMASAYVPLVREMKKYLKEVEEQMRSAGLKALLDFVSHIENAEVFAEMEEDIRQILEEYNRVSCLGLEFGYYEGLREVVINNQGEQDNLSCRQSLISKILQNAAVFLDDEDRGRCKIYYDERFSKLEELILERLQLKSPEIFDRLQKFYKKYSNYNFDKICALRFEAEFYLRFSGLVRRMGNYGLKFCKPEIYTGEDNKTSILGLYDLSLALQMEESGITSLSECIVSNELDFNENGRIFVVTGPNKGGKTTYIRSIGIAQVLFQAGCFVPALEARMSIVDTVYTHFPKEETLGVKKGRLGEEAERISLIVNSCTSKSLVLLNETFSSTRSVDGYYLGRDMLKILMETKCLGLYVTHFNELAYEVDELSEEVPGGSRLASLTGGIVDFDGRGVEGSRTYKILRIKPSGHGYSRDIVLKHGLSSEQLEMLLRKRGYLT